MSTRRRRRAAARHAQIPAFASGYERFR